MAQFRKKPVVIEAWQYVGYNFRGPLLRNPGETQVYIETLEGPLNVNDGDWIITGVKGEVYPCKPDVFDATYEPVYGVGNATGSPCQEDAPQAVAAGPTSGQSA
jgi:hypothetical protein